MNFKIREAQLQKIPYMIVIGDREQTTSTISLRLRNGKDMGALSLGQFETIITSAIEAKRQD
jgi:threonyl-tRNA synthetase